MKLITIIILTSLITSCASKPVLYPNQKLKSVGKEQANSDVDYCLEDADAFLETSKAKQIMGNAGKGSIIGAVAGGVTGALTGDFGGALARGALVGGAVGGTAGAISPDQLKRRYVNLCLKERGYRVIGWN